MEKTDHEELKELDEKAHLHGQNALEYFSEAKQIQRQSIEAVNSNEQFELIKLFCLKSKQAIAETREVAMIQTQINDKQRKISHSLMESLNSIDNRRPFLTE